MSTPQSLGQRAHTRLDDLMRDSEQGALAIRRVVVAPCDVVYLKGILEASEGLAVLLAEQGGELALVTTRSQARDLDALIDDLAGELPLRRRGEVRDNSPAEAGQEARRG